MLAKLDNYKDEQRLKFLALDLQYGVGNNFRKYSPNADLIAEEVFSELEKITSKTKRPLVKINISPSDLEALTSSISSNEQKAKDELTRVYKHIFDTYMASMVNSPLADTPEYARLVELSKNNFANIFYYKSCRREFNKQERERAGILDDAPLMSGLNNIGGNLIELYTGMTTFDNFTNKNKIYHHEDIPYDHRPQPPLDARDYPRVIFNLTGFPVVEKLDFSAWDKQIEELKKGTNLLPQKNIDYSLRNIVIHINGFLDRLMNGGEGFSRSVAFPGWVRDLVNEKPDDSQIMGMGPGFGESCMELDELLAGHTNYII